MILFKHGLYLVTDERLLARGRFLAKVDEALSQGVDVIQLREKAAALRDRAALGRGLVALAHRRGARVVINDDPWLALRLGADGVHLGQDDPPVEAARDLLGSRAIIGVSCYDDLSRALRMERQGADYVSFGAFERSPTKPKEALVPESILTRAKSLLSVPVVAIGGIGPPNVGRLIEAGADCLAVVSSVFARRDPSAAARELRSIIRSHRKP